MNNNVLVGYEKVKCELKSLSSMLHDSKKLQDKGLRIPRGILLSGKPGVGKTTLAKSIAGDGISLVEFRMAECDDEKASQIIHGVFEEARHKAPSLILLDEIDKMISPMQIFPGDSAHDNIQQILMREIDQLTENDAVMVVATCNDLKCLGKALLRPGRFDRIIEIELPDEAERNEILRLYYSKLQLGVKMDIGYLAKITGGYSGAMLECLVNESGIHAIQKKRKNITLEDAKVVINRMSFECYEKEPTKDISELRKIATHEAGHAVAAMFLCPDDIHEASITPQGQSGGHVKMAGDENQVPSVTQIENKIAIMLAGRVAERIVSKEIRLGSQRDLAHASETMLGLIIDEAAYGYKYIIAAFSSDNQTGTSSIMSESLKNDISDIFDEKMKMLDSRAEEVITGHRDLFDRVVNELLEKKVLSRKELFELKDTYERAAA